MRFYVDHKIGDRVIRLGEHCTCQQWVEQDEAIRTKCKHEEDEFERRQREMRLHRLFEESLIPSRWKQRTFASFDINDYNQKAHELAKKFADEFDPQSGDGLLLTGPVGTGKTHLCAAISMALLEKEHSVVFGTVTSLLGQLRQTFDDGSRINEREVMDKFTRCRLLIIDDLGKEKATEWVEQTLYEIINARYEDNKSIIITTNMSLANIRSKYPNNGDAMVDRILETCRGVKMDGESWRKKALL